MISKIIGNSIFQIVFTWLLGLVTSIIIFRLENKRNKRADIPKLNITLFVKGNQIDIGEELKEHEHFIKFYYKEHEKIDGIKSSKKSIKFIEISRNEINKEFRNTNFFVFSFEGGEEIGLVISKLFDSEYNDFNIDEKKILVNRMGAGRYCLLCKESDKPSKITGVYDEKYIAYNIGIKQKGPVIAKFGKKTK